jgi:hypothetical protein
MRWRATLMPIVRLRWIPISWGFLAILCACAFVPHQSEWIAVGHTTREEVIDAYGEPDLVMTATEGETVVYRSRAVGHSSAHMEIPTAQAGPRGMVATKMEPVVRGYGSTSSDEGLRGRPDRELRIRYDAQGIVRELIR